MGVFCCELFVVSSLVYCILNNMVELLMIPWWQYQVFIFGFGVIIGSFLNVFIYRFHTGKSLAGSSHCLSCQTPLRWYDLFPLVSFVALRGRCRSCSALIPSRYFWVELSTAVLFVVVAMTTTSVVPLVLGLMLAALLVVIVVYDIAHMIIPDGFVIVLLVVAMGAVGYGFYLDPTINNLFSSLLGAVASFVFFWALWAYSKGQWIGFGDAKLAIPLGLMVGAVGTFSMLILSFWIGTVISLGLIAYQQLIYKRGQPHLRFLATPLTMKSEVPFAPFLILGFIAVYFFHVDVLEIVSYVTYVLIGS